MRGPGTSKNCVTKMAADEEAAIAPLSRSKERRDCNGFAECSVSAIHKGEETHPSNTGYAIRYLGYLLPAVCLKNFNV